MRYVLPAGIKNSLARREVRLHHLLWHAIRDSWHDFSEAERETMRQNHPGWVPNIPRFISVEPTAANPSGIEINFEAGESFLYMHRRMIQDVNVQLLAIGEPALVPWPEIPEITDPDYPVPNRRGDSDSDNPKSDAHLMLMKSRAAQVRNEGILQGVSLARVGAFIESAIHDFMHMRWADAPGLMENFPPFGRTDVSPAIDDMYNHPTVDYLGHPYSSHVSSLFWKLHGWIDETIEHWRTANGLETIDWNDTWTGDYPQDRQPEFAAPVQPLSNLERMHDHFDHRHHGWHEMFEVFETINGFENCHASFTYVQEAGIPLPEL